MRVLSASALVALLASGCLPDRSNPVDPAEAPRPVLRVVDRTGPDGCETTDPEEDWPTAPAAFRGTCLALDARASTDPQGAEIDDLYFTFERLPVDETGAPEPLGEAEARGAAILILDQGFVRDLPVGSETTFRVTVKDQSGAHGSATTHVTMLNHAPVADPPPLRIVPLGASGSVASVPFFATATDEDGDQITQWRWTDPAGTVLATTSSWSLSIATDIASRRILWVEAFDGVSWSERAPSPVRIGREAVWATTKPAGATPFDHFARLGERRVFRTLLEGSTPHDVAFVSDVELGPGVSPRMAIRTDSSVLLVDWPSLSVLDSVTPFLGPGAAMRFDQDGNIWLATSAYTNGLSQTVRRMSGYSTAGDVLAPIIPDGIEVLADFSDVGDDYILIEVDDAGNVWVAARHGDVVRAFSPSPSGMTPTGSTQSPPGSVVKSLTRRPGSPGVWVLQGQALTGSAPAEPALLHLSIELDGNGIVRSETPLAVADADGLTWEDASRFWASLTGHGLCLVDAAALALSNGAPDSAIDFAFPTTIGFSNFVNDPIAGVGWWSSTSHELVAKTSITGEVDILLADADVKMLDPSGGLWFLNGPMTTVFGTLSVGEAPSFGSVSAEFLTSAIASAPDGQGGLWIATLQPRALQRIAPTGEIIDSVTDLDLGSGGVVPIPVALAMGFDGEDSIVLHGVVDTDEPFPFFRVSLANRTPFSPAPAPAEIVHEDFVLPAARIYVPPASVGEHFFWQNSFSFGTFEISLTDAQGVTSPVLPTESFDSWKAEISRVDGRLCIADVSGTTADIREISPTGNVTLTTSITFAAQPHIVGVGFSSDPDGANELCWIGIQETEPLNNLPALHLLAYDGAGSFVRGYYELRDDLDDDATSLTVLGRDSIWILWSAGAQSSMEAIEFSPLGSADRLLLGPTNYDTFLGR